MSEFDETISTEDMNAEDIIDVVTLFEEDGTETEYEFLDLVEYEGKTYAILLPLDEEENDGTVIILEVRALDDENEEYLDVEDASVLNAVFEIFKERFQDEFDFVEE